MSLNKNRFVTFCIIVVLNIIIGVFVLRAVVTPSFSPDSPQGRQSLQTSLKTSRPLIVALQHFRRDRGHFPASLRELSSVYLPASGVAAGGHLWNGWGYRPEAPWGDGYRLTMSLGRDPFLFYNGRASGRGEAGYDPGNGNPKVTFN